MPKHIETKHLKYTPEELYALVADINRYPEFLPWCSALNIISASEDEIVAEIVIGFKFINERFRTKVKLTPSTKIVVKCLSGPFKYLNNYWTFESNKNGGCIINFFVEFEFRSPILGKVMDLIFNEAMKKMILAFENRAKYLYRPKN